MSLANHYRYARFTGCDRLLGFYPTLDIGPNIVHRYNIPALATAVDTRHLYKLQQSNNLDNKIFLF